MGTRRAGRQGPGRVRRAAAAPVRVVAAPFRAAGRFVSWVRHSQADTEAVYGPDPNDVPAGQRAAKAAVVLHGLGGGGQQGGGMA